MGYDLKQIKKIYGEEMMHLCRELFPSLLEKEGLLLSILEQNLAATRFLAKDVKDNHLYEEFKNWIFSFIDVEKNKEVITNKIPSQLMDEAGYILYECKTEEDIQSFKKYYKPGEVLCTISNGGRLRRCYVFFAVKKNVDEIRREDFSEPKREDEYGTSVISIQFSRGKANDLSIKNRYNHTVNNPDATFSNNLDNIVPGLTNSFEQYYNFNINKRSNKSKFLTSELNYVKGVDGKYYNYYIEINGVYYCENNIIISDGNVITTYSNNPERYVFADQYIIDMKEKTIKLFDGNESKDSFLNSIYDVGNIKNIEVKKNESNKIIYIHYDNNNIVEIEINRSNSIIGYKNNYIVDIKEHFLSRNSNIKNISLPEVRTIGDDFLVWNDDLDSISLPKVQTIGCDFLLYNVNLKSLYLPEVKSIGIDFLLYNEELSEIYLPELKKIDNDFLCSNSELSQISLPKVESIGDNFLNFNENISSIHLPEVKSIGNDFLWSSGNIDQISLPKVESIKDNFLSLNQIINSIYLPEVKSVGSNFLSLNTQLNSISLPQLESVGDNFLNSNEKLSSIYLPKVKKDINLTKTLEEMEKNDEQVNNSRSK